MRRAADRQDPRYQDEPPGRRQGERGARRKLDDGFPQRVAVFCVGVVIGAGVTAAACLLCLGGR